MITARLALSLLLLTAGGVALFAMMGELASKVDAMASRIQEGGVLPAADDWARLEEDIVGGAGIDEWPFEPPRSTTEDYGLIVVLSSACQSCNQFLQGDLDDLREFKPVFVVSCPSLDRADQFLQSHEILEDQPVYRDVMGRWTREQLRIEVSPAAILVQGDRPIASFTMSSPSSLADAVREKIESTEKVA